MQHNYCNHQQIIQTKTTIHIMANISPEMNTNIRIHTNKHTYIYRFTDKQLLSLMLFKGISCFLPFSSFLHIKIKNITTKNTYDAKLDYRKLLIA